MNIIEKTYKWASSLSKRKSTNRIVLHHAEASNCTADQIHSWHLSNGWSGIGYHFFVRKDGTIYRGRPENMIGSHAKGANSDSIGICAEGNYMKETMTYAQKKSISELVTHLKNKYGITKVQRHKDVCSTDCPGVNYPFSEIINGVSEPVQTIKVAYNAHVQDIGWTEVVCDGNICGTTGQNKRLEAIHIDTRHSNLELYVKAHIANEGWHDYGKIDNNTVIGTVGKGEALECLCLNCINANLVYRVHIQNFGWSAWTKADGISTLGTVGQSLNLEAVQIKVV